MSTIMVKASITNYTIKTDDTLYTIAHKHHTTIEEVRKANNLKRGDTLKLGKVLKVPINTYFPSKKTDHKIRIVKSVKKQNKVNHILKTALTKHSKPIASKRIKRHRDTVMLDDIFFKSSHPNLMFFGGKPTQKAKSIIELAKTKLGRKYVWGAVGQRGTFDCSGFTNYVFRKNGIKIPRTSINQSKYGKYISRNNLKKGDLIFFDTSRRRKGYVNHVGIYLGNGKFIHASSAKKKVVVSNLDKFYARCYIGARRPS